MASVGGKGFDIKTEIKLWDVAEDVVIAAALKGQKKLANVILGESQKLVPVDSGTLQKSGTVSTDKASLITTISYNTPYARKQHEDTELDHSRNKNPDGQAKYLERPFNEKVGEYENYVRKEIYNALKSDVIRKENESYDIT